MDYAYYNGCYDRLLNTRLPLSDRSVFFGDGVYDCMVGKHGKIYQEAKHISRLRSCASELFLNLEISDVELTEIFGKLIALAGYEKFVIYIQVSRHAAARKHYVPDFGNSNILITVTEHNPQLTDLISLVSCDDIRYKMCNVKTLNLLPSVLASKFAAECGCDEAVFVRSGIVTECSHSNISILKSGVLITHPLDRYILPGITRVNLINAANKLGIPVAEKCYGYKELIEADEVIVTSTTAFARRVCKIDESCISCSSPQLAKSLCDALRSDYDEYCC